MSFTGKVVLITGASSGIGAHAAIHLSSRGASVAIVGRNSQRLHEVAEKIRDQKAPEPLEIVADVTIDNERIIAETVAKFGKLDVLVNNAGIAILSEEPLGSLDAYDQVMRTNVRSVLELTKCALPHLEATRGNVVNVSSYVGSVAYPRQVSYPMSKAAQDHFTRCAAIELGAKGIRVNAVCPGLVDTPMFAVSGIDDETKKAMIEKSKEAYPLRRITAEADVSSAIEFLAGDGSSFITGHLLFVDGGKHLVGAYETI